MLKVDRRIRDIKDLRFQASLMGALTRGRCSGGVLRERCFEDMRQICRKHPCRSLISVGLLYHSSPVGLQHNLGGPFYRDSDGVIWMVICQIISEIAAEIRIFYFGVFSWGVFWDWLVAFGWFRSYAGYKCLNLRKKQSNNRGFLG